MGTPSRHERDAAHPPPRRLRSYFASAPDGLRNAYTAPPPCRKSSRPRAPPSSPPQDLQGRQRRSPPAAHTAQTPFAAFPVNAPPRETIPQSVLTHAQATSQQPPSRQRLRISIASSRHHPTFSCSKESPNHPAHDAQMLSSNSLSIFQSAEPQQ